MSGIAPVCMGGWRIAARTDATHPPGTLVAKPAHSFACWGCVLPYQRKGQPHEKEARSCPLNARADHLTCNAHRKREAAAQRLKKQLDAAKETA